MSEVLNLIIALATVASVIILYFYTKYTYRMQKAVEEQAKELVRQRQLSILPLLVIEVGDNILLIKNVGNGTAINIKTKSAKINESGVAVG
jgi:hypothetical protein